MIAFQSSAVIHRWSKFLSFLVLLSQACALISKKVTEVDVTSALRELNVWKSTGLDGLSARILRKCSSELAESLSFVFNFSLAEGIYPDQWKEALINPIYKNRGNKSEPTSYRPISLLRVVSKVFGWLLKKQLLPFFLDDNAIPDEQFGLLPGRSTL